MFYVKTNEFVVCTVPQTDELLLFVCELICEFVCELIKAIKEIVNRYACEHIVKDVTHNKRKSPYGKTCSRRTKRESPYTRRQHHACDVPCV